MGRGWGAHAGWLPALPLAALSALVQVAGSWARAEARGEHLSVVAVLLLLAGPAAILLLARYPLVPLAVAITASVAYLLLGQPAGPIFAAPVAALLLEGFRRRRERFAAMRRERRSQEALARTDERMAMARDLHDALGHSLTLINVQAGAALHTFDREPENARRALATVRAESHRALEEVRRVLDTVRDPSTTPATRPQPGLAELEPLVAADPDFAWHLDVGGSPEHLPSGVDAAAFRVVQEAMTNVRRHSAARSARIVVRRVGDVLEVVVADPGPAATGAPTGAGGTGLVGMQERVSAVGGTVEAGPVRGGWRTVARIPIHVGSAP